MHDGIVWNVWTSKEAGHVAPGCMAVCRRNTMLCLRVWVAEILPFVLSPLQVADKHDEWRNLRVEPSPLVCRAP